MPEIYFYQEVWSKHGVVLPTKAYIRILMRLLSQALGFRTSQNCDGLSNSCISYLSSKPFTEVAFFFFLKGCGQAVKDCFIMHVYGEEGIFFFIKTTLMWKEIHSMKKSCPIEWCKMKYQWAAPNYRDVNWLFLRRILLKWGLLSYSKRQVLWHL